MFDFGAGLAVNVNARSNVRLWSSEAGVLRIVWLELVLEIRKKKKKQKPTTTQNKQTSHCPRNYLRKQQEEKQSILCCTDFLQGGGGSFLGYFYFCAFSLRNKGVEEANIRETSFYLKNNTNRRKTFSSKLVDLK